MEWSLKYIKMQELNCFDLFYSIAAMSYPCLIAFLQTSYLCSLTETLEWSIVLWLVNHSKS